VPQFLALDKALGNLKCAIDLDSLKTEVKNSDSVYAAEDELQMRSLKYLLTAFRNAVLADDSTASGGANPTVA